MRDLASLTADDFRPHRGDRFVVHRDDGELPFVLERVEPLRRRRDGREPFALLFRGPAHTPLPQQVHRFVHPELGELDIFVVPVEVTADGLGYEAIFA